VFSCLFFCHFRRDIQRPGMKLRIPGFRNTRAKVARRAAPVLRFLAAPRRPPLKVIEGGTGLNLPATSYVSRLRAYSTGPDPNDTRDNTEGKRRTPLRREWHIASEASLSSRFHIFFAWQPAFHMIPLSRGCILFLPDTLVPHINDALRSRLALAPYAVLRPPARRLAQHTHEMVSPPGRRRRSFTCRYPFQAPASGRCDWYRRSGCGLHGHGRCGQNIRALAGAFAWHS
jgi:hypothetical protein